MAYDLTSKTPQQILDFFRNLIIKEGENFEIELLEADIERIGYKAFIDLAQIFSLKLLTHTKKADSAILSFYKLKKENSFHNEEKGVEKYGTRSQFFQIDKTSQFSFLYYYQEALSFVDIKSKKRVLNLGVNRGDEFRVIKEMLNKDTFTEIEFVGIDYSPSAIEYAKTDFFEDKNIEFICHDINNLSELNLGKFDLIISIGTLQSSNIEFNAAFMSMYQNYLAEGGAIVLGFPNCRWVDSEMIYGAKAPNYSFSELSLVLKDIHFCKKYLQQKKYRVVVTGKDYLFLSARKITAL
ncbi:MAG: hypothetical protein QG559_928 [Campylobacterota bacterium]|nr:hypothetical protein [Campylobacterota bacterium]